MDMRFAEDDVLLNGSYISLRLEVRNVPKKVPVAVYVLAVRETSNSDNAAGYHDRIVLCRTEVDCTRSCWLSWHECAVILKPLWLASTHAADMPTGPFKTC